jgi:carboxynorspermidine decarboxylase
MGSLPFDPAAPRTPAFVVDRELLIRNLSILRGVKERSGCKILLAQKAFSMFYFYPLIGQYLDGTTASGLYEARLGQERLGGETHVFSAAYRPEEFPELLSRCGHVVFNSLSQWQLYRELVLASGVSPGLRINPECSTQEHAVYDPC